MLIIMTITLLAGQNGLAANRPESERLRLEMTVQQAQGDLEAAAATGARAVALARREVTEKPGDLAFTLNNLALIHQKAGDHRHAEPLFREALPLWEKAYGPEDDNVASSLGNLGGCCLALKKTREAEAFLRRSLEVRGKVHHGDSPEMLPCLNQLAILYQFSGRMGLCIQELQHAVAVCDRFFGDEHIQTAICSDNLAGLFFREGKLVEAEKYCAKALKYWENNGTPDHPLLGLQLVKMSQIKEALGQDVAAAGFADRATKIFERNKPGQAY